MKQEKIKDKYVFPSFMAKGMANMSTRVQFEASMMSIVFVILGLIVGTVYTIFFTHLSLFVKILAGVNATAGVVFLLSFMVTQFQMYISHMAAMQLGNDLFNEQVLERKEDEEKTRHRKDK